MAAEPPFAEYQAPPAGAGTSDEHTWAMLCHLSALAAYVGIPFGNIVGPLIVWLVKREESAFVDDQGKEAVNFQISMFIYGVVAALLILVLVGIVLLPALLVFNLVMIVVASVRANRGERFRYPLCIRFLS